MNRRLLPLLLASLWLLPQAHSADPQRPNIVMLYADDMGFGDLGIQNPESKIPTPHLDQLAREGTRFTDAHSSSGICTPSRYAMLNGRYHWRKFHGIVNSFDQPVMDDARITLAEMLKAKGYRTACIGKWHLGWDWDAIKKPGAAPQGRREEEGVRAGCVRLVEADSRRSALARLRLLLRRRRAEFPALRVVRKRSRHHRADRAAHHHRRRPRRAIGKRVRGRR